MIEGTINSWVDFVKNFEKLNRKPNQMCQEYSIYERMADLLCAMK